ncbi:MAG TPA: Glu-tRNA(Gln) amidotransferase subunit GatE [Hadesarchaea archaeon]|nr:Glu-tRNA(Gln) amidotransferase subunit GatE [Hadesarchaea archaeon]
MEPDYKKLGLRVGFEIHQELDTRKLFCNCPSKLREERPPMEVKRRLRPTQSEMGEVDRAALAEVLKNKGFAYQLYPDTVCLVELDDEPPHPINEEALDIALEVAFLLKAKPVNEVHTMRKIVIDGSNTCGFQRTALVATDGVVDVCGKDFRIPTICLEEDAARKVGEDIKHTEYRLDRLGIPLIEIATDPDFSDPHTPAKTALYIGQLLRATGKAKRGIGTIRQDINISIRGGARQEIKGVQELGLISTVIEREVQRQLTLLEICDELKKRGVAPVKKKITDLTNTFSKTNSRVIRKALKAGGNVLAARLPKFAGLLGKELQPGRRFGTELADRARFYGKVGGLFHTDELPAYGISEEEVEELKSLTGAEKDDAIVFIVGSRRKVEIALGAVIDRVNQALDGVPEETRRALPDGNTEFTRPLPGAGRMYPETDIPPIPITPSRLRKIKSKLPELPEERRTRLMKKYGLSVELAERMMVSENLELFEELATKTRIDPKLIATTIEETMVGLRREGVKIENVQKTALLELFTWIAEEKVAKEAVPDVLRLLAQRLNVQEAVSKLGLTVITRSELEKFVAEIVANNLKLIEERGMGAMKPLMGILMEKVRGKADGKLVHELLQREIQKLKK